jgi:KilA-N domain
MSNSSIVPSFSFHVDTIRKDGLVNISALASAYQKTTGKRKDPHDWLETRDCNESIAYLERVTGKPVTSLVVVEHGVGTWVHSDLAEIFAQWISVEYRFAVVALIRKAKEPQTEIERVRAYLAALEAKAELEIINSQLTEENQQLSEAVDELFSYSSIIRIAKFNKCDEKLFNWRLLKNASKNSGLEIKRVPCPRFGEKLLYPHDAWRLAYPAFNLPETTTLVISR